MKTNGVFTSGTQPSNIRLIFHTAKLQFDSQINGNVQRVNIPEHNMPLQQLIQCSNPPGRNQQINVIRCHSQTVYMKHNVVCIHNTLSFLLVAAGTNHPINVQELLMTTEKRVLLLQVTLAFSQKHKYLDPSLEKQPNFKQMSFAIKGSIELFLYLTTALLKRKI